MATHEPEDPDEAFRQITENLVVDDPGQINSPANWTDRALMSEQAKLKQRLRDLNQVHFQTNREGREIYAQLTTINFHLKQRGFM